MHWAACSVWAASPPAPCAPPRRARSCSLACRSPEPPTTTPWPWPTACAPDSAWRFAGSPGTAHDALAIEVFGPRGHKLGYVPRRRNEMPARLVDAGKRLSARAESIERRGNWLNIQMSLYLDAA